MSGYVNRESFIGGTDGYYVSGVRLSRIFLRRVGAAVSSAGDYPNVWGHVGFPPATLALRYIRDIRMDALEISGPRPMHWNFIDNGRLNGQDLPVNGE